MEKVKIIIDEKEISVNKGEKILWVALDNGIYIPNLCAIREREIPFGGCRLCFVEIEIDGRKKIVTSCSEPVREGMKIKTATEEVNRLRKTAFELLMTTHEIDCPNCSKRKTCELLKIASYLKMKIKPKRLKALERNFSVDFSHPLFGYNPNKCINCEKCIFMCQKYGKGILNFVNRSIQTRVSTFWDIPLSLTDCSACLECVKVCPAGALFEKNEDSQKKKFSGS